jgi:hypothetical protein
MAGHQQTAPPQPHHSNQCKECKEVPKEEEDSSMLAGREEL